MEGKRNAILIIIKQSRLMSLNDFEILKRLGKLNTKLQVIYTLNLQVKEPIVAFIMFED